MARSHVRLSLAFEMMAPTAGLMAFAAALEGAGKAMTLLAGVMLPAVMVASRSAWRNLGERVPAA